jgi:hypothetical protein
MAFLVKHCTGLTCSSVFKLERWLLVADLVLWLLDELLEHPMHFSLTRSGR